jgi:ApaG protein
MKYSAAMSDKTTRGIRVQVESFYDEERSSPQDSYYFFAYRVKISNVGQETAQLISREWIITDGNGDIQRVQGPGVVGEQPTLAPGEEFEYTSFCPLPTPVGSMHGSYLMVLASGERFEAEIAPFPLAAPHAVN